MSEAQKVFEDLTQLLDSFLQQMVQCSLVSGYSLSLTTYPESFTSKKTLPLFLTLVQQLQDGIKKLLILYDNKETQNISCKLILTEQTTQESAADNCKLHIDEEREDERDREASASTKEITVIQEENSASDVIDIDNVNHENSEESNNYEEIRRDDTIEPKTGQDCVGKTEDFIHREDESSLEHQLVVVEDEMQVLMEDEEPQTLVPAQDEPHAMVQDSVQEGGTEEIGPTLDAHIDDLDEESTLELPEAAEDQLANEKEEDKIQFKCSECPREFKSASSRETHRMKFHAAPQSCDMCGQVLGSTAALQEHCRAVHDGAGCFQCPMCKRRFMLRLSFRRHLETHEPAATMAVCEICGKSFRRADYLQRHYLSHTGQRPHVCSICGKSFLCTSHLKNHMTALHNTQSYPCNLCGRVFARPDKLKEHRLRHFNIKRHACSQCGKEYAERRDLKKHMEHCTKATTANCS